MREISIFEGGQETAHQLIKGYRQLTSAKELLSQDELHSEWLDLLGRFHRAGFEGKGQTIAVIDTGYDLKNELLKSSVVEGACIDFTGEGMDDKNGHGTLVSLLILACAPKAKLVPIKMFNARGRCRDEDVFKKAIEHTTKCGATVVNVSGGLTRTGKDPVDYMKTPEGICVCPICKTATEVIHSNGLSIFAAIGNSGNSSDGVGRDWNCPSCAQGVVPVIGLTGDQPIYNSMFTKIMGIGAPGVVIRPMNSFKKGLVKKFGGFFKTLEGDPAVGSSFATPMVAGTGALMQEFFDLHTPKYSIGAKDSGLGFVTFFESHHADYYFPLKDFFKHYGHDEQPDRPRFATGFFQMERIANAVLEKKEFASAIRAFGLMVELFKDHPNNSPIGLAHLMNSLGVCHLRGGHITDARRIFEEALAICRANSQNANAAEVQNILENNIKLASDMFGALLTRLGADDLNDILGEEDAQ